MKHIFVKIFAFVILLIGKLVRQAKPSYKFREIRSILIKRTDRIGDAVVSLPLILELAKKYNVTVLTSKYNDSFLNKFVPTLSYINDPLGFSDSIKEIIRNTVFPVAVTEKHPPKYDLFLDLNGVRDLDSFLKMRKNNLCRYYAGFNMGIWNLFLDYAYPGYVGLFAKKHIVSAYARIIKDSLGFDAEIPDYLDLSDKMVKPEDFNEEGFILVNIAGVNKFRGPSPDKYAEIINRLSFAGKIVVMDELGRPNIEEFKRYVKRDNIAYLNRDYSLWELLFIASKSILYIGADSGITHLLQVSANAFIFFGTGIPWVWKPYSKNTYVKKEISGMVFEETKNSQGLVKKIVYKPVWCRPCFDMGCRRKRCLEFDFPAVVREIENMDVFF